MAVQGWMTTGMVLMLAIYFPSQSGACTCQHTHPQASFCQADFVIKARVKDDGETLYSQRKVKRDGKTETQMYPTYLRYAIRTSRIFKETPSFSNVTHHYVYTSPFDSTCGIQLNNNTKYLLEGYVHNGKPIISECSNIKPWHEVQVRQRKGYNYLYEDNCKCMIKECHSKNCEKMHGPLYADECHIISDNTWNCYSAYSMCIRRENGQCHWSRSNMLKLCLHQEQSKTIKEL